MPVFIRPAKVTVSDGGGVPGWVVAAAVAAVVLYAIWSLIPAIVLALSLTAVVAVAAAVTVLWAVLRANRAALWSPQQAAAVRDVRTPALGASSPAAIEGKRPATLLGIVLDGDQEVKR